MSVRIFIILSLVFALLQGPFLPPIFVEGILLVMLIYANANTSKMRIDAKVWAGLFFGGLIFDLLQGRILGVTSLIFGVGAFGLNWRNPWILGLVALSLDLARSKLVFGEFLWFPSLVCAVATILLFQFLWRSSDMVIKLR